MKKSGVKFLKGIISVVAVLVFVVVISGCSKEEGALEKAGEKADKAIEETTKAAEKAGEKVGEKVSEGTEAAKDAVQKAGEKVSEGAGKAAEAVKKGAEKVEEKVKK